MVGLTVLGVFCLLWAVATAYIALAKPKRLWEMGKIQGFAKLLGDTVATILFLLLAAGMAGVGAWLTFLR